MLAMLSHPMLSHPAFDAFDAMMTDAVRISALPGCRIDATSPQLQEHDTRYTLNVVAPGVSASDLVVECIDGRLTVKGETRNTHFVCTVAMPRDADADAATATCAQGLLTVELPKKAEAEPARIAVSTDAEMAEEVEQGDAASTRPYQLTLVAAGLAASDVEVVAEERGVLRVKGETARTGAKLARSFQLPRDADAQRATATHVDGILTITVPKKSAAAKRLLLPVGVPSSAADAPAAVKEAEDAMQAEDETEEESAVMV